MMRPPSSKKLKVVFLGNADVGKSSLFRRYLNGDFEIMTNTVGAALGLVEMIPSAHDPKVYIKGDVVSMGDRTTPPPRGASAGRTDAVRVQIWDTAGQEQYASLLPMYFRNADVCICVIDCTEGSCDRIPGIIEAIEEENATKLPVIALWRNKSDLVPDTERVAEFVKAYPGPVDCRAVVSAKTDDGVSAAFEECISLAIARRHQQEAALSPTTIVVPNNSPQDGGGGCAC
eukprot:m.98062 g.98062  ORF g.98062 m.98062 type:complete len:231 (-) comp12417_c0_seq2:943-1635(-)